MLWISDIRSPLAPRACFRELAKEPFWGGSIHSALSPKAQFLIMRFPNNPGNRAWLIHSRFAGTHLGLYVAAEVSK